MKKYPYNSPQAMARILIMQMIGDGNFDPSEIDELEHLNVYDVLDISRKIAQSLSFSRQLLFYPGVTFVDAIAARFVLAILLPILSLNQLVG